MMQCGIGNVRRRSPAALSFLYFPVNNREKQAVGHNLPPRRCP
jgi:hypothetical protein